MYLRTTPTTPPYFCMLSPSSSVLSLAPRGDVGDEAAEAAVDGPHPEVAEGDVKQVRHEDRRGGVPRRPDVEVPEVPRGYPCKFGRRVKELRNHAVSGRGGYVPQQRVHYENTRKKYVAVGNLHTHECCAFVSPHITSSSCRSSSCHHPSTHLVHISQCPSSHFSVERFDRWRRTRTRPKKKT